MNDDATIKVYDPSEPPEGKVKTMNGEIIDRSDAVFLLTPWPKDKTVLVAQDKTVYKKLNDGGTLKRVTPKKLNKKLRAKQRKEANERQRNSTPDDQEISKASPGVHPE